MVTKRNGLNMDRSLLKREPPADVIHTTSVLENLFFVLMLFNFKFPVAVFNSIFPNSNTSISIHPLASARGLKLPC